MAEKEYELKHIADLLSRSSKCKGCQELAELALEEYNQIPEIIAAVAHILVENNAPLVDPCDDCGCDGDKECQHDACDEREEYLQKLKEAYKKEEYLQKLKEAYKKMSKGG